jgi:dTDP-4-amino-4,6-dideoxygalactose transaminase
VEVPFNNLFAQYQSLKPEIDDAISSVIAESAFVRGRFVEKFEQDFAEAIGIKHCVSCGNGTDALYIAIRALGLEPGDEVITTAHTWISTAETITQAGGRVVFCDTELDSFLIDADQIESLITEKTRGIIPVHLYGQPADMDEIMAIANKYKLWVIEDCAQAHLAEYKGQQVGTFGNAATFSFYPGKNLGAMGDAGAIVTNDDHLAEWMTLFARHGGKGDHQIEGINSRLDGIQAAVLTVKLSHLQHWTTLRKHWASEYSLKLGGLSEIKTPSLKNDRSHVFHLYVLKFSSRDNLREALKNKGIQTVVNYPLALPNCKAYKANMLDSFPNATQNQHQILSIPIYPEITQEEVDYIVESIKSSI